LAPKAAGEAARVLVVARPGADDYNVSLRVDGVLVEAGRWTVGTAATDSRTITLPALSPGTHVVRAIADFGGLAVSSDRLSLVSADDGTIPIAEADAVPTSAGEFSEVSEEQSGALIDTNRTGIVDSEDVVELVLGRALRPEDLCQVPTGETDPSGTATAEQGASVTGPSPQEVFGRPSVVAVTLAAPRDSSETTGPHRVRVSLTPATGTCVGEPTSIDLGEITLSASLPAAWVTFDDSRFEAAESTGVVSLTLGTLLADGAGSTAFGATPE
jgi:hypothetical protein